MSICRCRQLEIIQKKLINNNIKVRATVLYEIILVEVGTFPLETISITKLIS